MYVCVIYIYIYIERERESEHSETRTIKDTTDSTDYFQWMGVLEAPKTQPF